MTADDDLARQAARVADGRDDGLQRLLDHVKGTRGVDLSGYKATSLTRRIRKRMAAVHATTFDDYLTVLDGNDDEFAALFDTVLINVTSFFRDAETWQVVADEVIPSVINEREPGDPLRVWVAGCASGEEAYTIAILLCEALGESAYARRVKIYATDADEGVLAQARLGRFPHQALAESVPTPLIERYFDAKSSDLVFRKTLRRTIVFGRHDLVRDPPISRVDLLTCRNTLMYFTPPTQRHILRQLHFALRPTGYLVLGRSEALATRNDLFTPFDLKRRVFRRVASSKEATVSDHRETHRSGPPPSRISEGTGLGGSVFDVSPVAQVVVAADGEVVAINHQARQLFGLSAQDVGRSFQDLEISYRPLELRTQVDLVLAERHTRTIRAVEWQRGAERQWYDVTLQPLFSDRGVVEGTVIGFTIVTAQHLLNDELAKARIDLETAYEELQSTVEELETTNEELQSTNEELETTNEELHSTNEELETTNEELQSTNEELETMNDELRQRSIELDEINLYLEAILTGLQSAVVVVDREVRVRLWNRHAQELWGLRSDEVQGEHLLNLDIGLPVEHLRQPVRMCLAGEQPDEIELNAVNRRGRSVTCVVQASPLRSNADGEAFGAILLMQSDETGVARA